MPRLPVRLRDMRCRQLITGHGHHLLVTGDLVAADAIIAALADSTTHVGGMVQTDTLLSGRGAWLSLDAAEGFKAEHCSAYRLPCPTLRRVAIFCAAELNGRGQHACLRLQSTAR